jgi:tetratricopeptide (TPR) repeat protein
MMNDERQASKDIMIMSLRARAKEGCFVRHSSFVVRHSLWCFAVVACAAGVAVAARNPAPSRPGPLILDDVPQRLTSQPRTEAQRLRLEAASQFTAGTMHERREEYADALRCYQRALRCDPQSATVATAVIRVALRLKRKAEAIRYALKAVELEDADPTLLRGLGAYLTEEGDWSRAAALYEKAIAARGTAKETPSDILLRMEMGRLYYLTDKWKQAANCFARVLYAIKHPDEFGLDKQLVKVLLGERANTYQLIGECFLAAGRTEEALAAFDDAEKVAPNKALRQFNLARVYAKTGKPAEALAALEASFSEHLGEEGTVPYETLANVLGALGKKNELLSRLEKLRAVEPNNWPLSYYLAAQYRAAGKLDQAESLYLELIKKKPTVIAYRSIAELARQKKRFDVLLDVLGDALEKASVLEVLGAESQVISRDAEAVRGLVEAARKQMQPVPERFGYGKRLAVASLALEAKQYETAGEFFNLALAVAKTSPPPESGKAAAGEKGSQRPDKVPAKAAPGAKEDGPDEAKSGGSKDKGAVEKPSVAAALASAADASPSRTAEVLMVWGVGLLMGDRNAEAAKVFQRGIDEKALPDKNPTFYFYLAGALALDGKYDAALAAAGIAAEKNKDSARFRGRSAWVLYVAKRYDEAAQAYRKLIDELDSDHVSAETRDTLRETRLALSNIAVIKGNLPQAEEWLEQVLDEFPDDEGAMNDLGYLWADQNKNLRRAEQMIRKALAVEPDNNAFHDSLGWVLYRLGKYPQAAAELEKAATGKKPDGVVLDHLGDVYLRLSQRDKALASWRKAAEVLKKDKEADKAAAVEKKISENNK